MSRGRPPKRDRRTELAVHLFVAGLVLASCAWILTDELKRLALAGAHPPVLDWARLFHHPADAALLPYVASALVAFGWGLLLYVGLRHPSLRTLRRLRRPMCARSVSLQVAVVAVQALLVLPMLPRGLRGVLAVLSVLACLVRRPAWVEPSSVDRPARAVRATFHRLATRALTGFCVAVTLALLVAISVEPVRLAMGPVRLLNEYSYLPERPLGYVGDRTGGEVRLREVAADRGCEFASANPLEYGLQSMTRGQLNHIGHVLNPINEVLTGKPLERTYFQYGVGATFLFKWVMDLAGGPSLQAYYRSLLLFVAYTLVFAATAIVLLRDTRHVLAAVGLLAASHYMLGYEALLLAPGINPLLHFLDLPVLLVCLAFFRTGRFPALVTGVFGAAAALATNALFGGLVLIALCVSAGLYVLENPRGRPGPRILALAGLVAAAVAAVALVLPRTSGGAITAQFLLGFFSWRPSPWLVLLTLVYLAASYLFLVWARDRRDPAKYAVVYLFVYTQGFLLYFHWSGLESHFWPALPYLGLHLLLMLRLLAGSPSTARWEPRVLVALLLGVALLVKLGADDYVAQRNGIKRLFARWETHRWPFPRARVIATADPAPLAASLAQIERHLGPGERGICILSVFDNLLPFLGGRHSIFPHFDLQWALLTEDQRRRAVEVVAAARPRFVFVGREVEGDVADPWEDLSCGLGMNHEQDSARGRVRELRRVFEAIAADYVRIETGPLLSVYRRRDGSP